MLIQPQANQLFFIASVQRSKQGIQSSVWYLLSLFLDFWVFFRGDLWWPYIDYWLKVVVNEC